METAVATGMQPSTLLLRCNSGSPRRVSDAYDAALLRQMMKLLLPLSICFAATRVFAQSVTFDSPQALTNQFHISGSFGGFTQVSSGGITGGAVRVDMDTSSPVAILRKAIPNEIGRTITTSMFFKHNAFLRSWTEERIPLALGLSVDAAGDPNNATGLTAGVYLKTRGDGTARSEPVLFSGFQSTVGASFRDLVDAHWYRLVVAVDTDGGPSAALRLSASLTDYGLDGMTAGPVIFNWLMPSTTYGATIVERPQVYAGFYGMRAGGAELLDNFAVTTGVTPRYNGDLAFKLTSDKTTAPVGGDVAYVMSVTNSGPVDSQAVEINWTFPDGLSSGAINCDQSCSVFGSDADVRVSLGNIPAGIVRHVYMQAKVTKTAALTLSATVTASTPDDHQANNSASRTINGSAPQAPSKLANISTRGRVGTGDDVLIGGFIVQGEAPKKLLLRAIGPSLAEHGLVGALLDPALQIVDNHGSAIVENDNWRSSQEEEIAATGAAPVDDAESAIIMTLPPGNYTAIVRGMGGKTGVAVVEAYDLQ